MFITLKCSSCGQKLKGKEQLAGKHANCPACGHVILVPPAHTAHQPLSLPPLPEVFPVDDDDDDNPLKSPPHIPQWREYPWLLYACGGFAVGCIATGTVAMIAIAMMTENPQQANTEVVAGSHILTKKSDAHLKASDPVHPPRTQEQTSTLENPDPDLKSSDQTQLPTRRDPSFTCPFNGDDNTHLPNKREPSSIADLAGNWIAQNGNQRIQLDIDPKGECIWTVRVGADGITGFTYIGKDKDGFFTVLNGRSVRLKPKRRGTSLELTGGGMKAILIKQ